MTTAQQIFDYAIAIMDSQSEAGLSDTADNAEYKNRTLQILNTMAGELYLYSDTCERDDDGRPVPALIRAWDKPIDLDDYICRTVMPYGLAAHLLLAEDPSVAGYCQQRYDELKAGLARGLPTVSEDIADVYGGTYPYNDFGAW